MKREQAGWLLIAMTFLGLTIGLSTMAPIKQDECIPRGYGRQRTESLLRPIDDVPKGGSKKEWI